MKYVLKLFISGEKGISLEAVANLDNLRKSYLKEDDTQIDIIDITEDPMLALENNVVVVPMLVMSEPEPSVTIIGSLRDMEKVSRALRIHR